MLPIQNREKVLSKLRTNGLYIQNYHNGVRNDLECIITAIMNNYLAYNFIGEKYKNNDKVIKLTIREYYKQQEKEYDISNADYYPEYLVLDQIANQIKNDLKEGNYTNHSDVIIEILKDLSDEEFIAFKAEYPNLAKTFIDENMDDHVANLINDLIDQKREESRNRK